MISISDLINSEIETKVYHVEEVFLKSVAADETIKIRKRGSNQVYSYYKETRSAGQQGRKVEINAVQYQQLRKNADPALKVITKKRICFLYESISFIIDNIHLEDREVQILRIEGMETEVGIDQIKIPDFIRVIKEVTDQSEYSTIEMARKK